MSNFFYPLIENPYRNRDINEGVKVLKSKKLTIGPKTDEFQKYFTNKEIYKYIYIKNKLINFIIK